MAYNRQYLDGMAEGSDQSRSFELTSVDDWWRSRDTGWIAMPSNVDLRFIRMCDSKDRHESKLKAIRNLDATFHVARETILNSLRAAEDRYVYFLLGIAAAAIAFAIQRTSAYEPRRDWADGFLLLAFALWATSFIAGCRNRYHHLAAVKSQFQEVVVGSMLVSELLKDATSLDERLESLFPISKNLSDELTDKGDKEGRKATIWFDVQFWLLVLGGVSFFVWHAAQVSRYEASTGDRASLSELSTQALEQLL